MFYANEHCKNNEPILLTIQCEGRGAILALFYFMNQEQKLIYERAIRGDNLLITGKAGTGKSFLTKQIINGLTKPTAVLASTGIAANNIEGETFHSFFSIKPFGVVTDSDINFVKAWKKNLFKKVQTIIVDEVSMLRADIFDAAFLTMQKNGINPFDKQWILVGDFKQLPPILEKNFNSIYYSKYKGLTVNYSDYYDYIGFEEVELKTVQRQSNPIFINSLNCIRENKPTKYFERFIKPVSKGIVICSKNVTVDRINKEELDKLPGKLITIKSVFVKDDKKTETEEYLKDGANVIYLMNSGVLSNGTLGIYRFKSNQHYFEYNGKLFPLKMESFNNYVYNEKCELVVASYTLKLPIKLAFAITVHRSQGLTFDNITVNYEEPFFETQQEYVALSRVKTPQGLTITNLKK